MAARDMRTEFEVHLLNEAGIEKATALGSVFSNALTEIEHLLGTAGGMTPEVARCRALVVTKLQEASFFAKRGIAVDPANQKP